MPDPISQDHEPYSEQGPIVNGVDPINAVVVADNIPQASASVSPDQIIAQALALATTDATALLRRVETTMSDVQSAALMRWIDAGSGEEDPRYQAIVRVAGQVLADAVGLWRDINVAAQQLLEALTDEGERAEPGSIVVEAARAEPATGKSKKPAKKKAAKKASKKAPAKKAAKKQPVAKKAAQQPSKKAAKKKPAAKPAKKAAAKKQPAAKPKPAPVVEVVPNEHEPEPEAAASNE